MLVRRGANTKFGNRKFDIETDETDLRRMLAEGGAEDPEAVAARMPTKDVYLALDHEAQAFLHSALRDLEPEEKQVHAEAAKRHRALRDKYLAPYLPRPVPAEEPAAEPAEAPA